MNEEIVVKVVQIMENMKNEIKINGQYKFSDEAKELISEVAEYCRRTKLYNHTKKDEPEFIRTESAEYLFLHMITKIAKAPSSLHSFGAVIIMMPAIDDAIKGGRVDDN